MNHQTPSQKLAAGLKKCADDYRAMNDKDETAPVKAARVRRERLASARTTLHQASTRVDCRDTSAIHEILSILLEEAEARS